jgi:hypothetical protein
MSARFEVVRRGSEGFRVYAGRNGARLAWSRTDWNGGQGMWYSTVGNANRAVKRLKANGYSKQKFFVRAILD